MKKVKLKPQWLKKKIFYSQENQEITKWIRQQKLHTVCEEARCPNRSECYHSRTATFLILGNICTRSCQFCSVETAHKNEWVNLEEPDESEIDGIIRLIEKMNLEYVVITSVDRDDLEDYGANHFANTIKTIKKHYPDLMIEVLTPDFSGREDLIEIILREKPHVFNHNIETVKRISPKIRRMSNYRTSLEVLEKAKQIDDHIVTKSGIMLGFGEQEEEVLETIRELSQIKCDILTIGQYLQATKKNIPVLEYISEDRFVYYKEKALELGIKVVQSGPFVRSSYKAIESYKQIKIV